MWALEYQLPGDAKWRRGLTFRTKSAAISYRMRAQRQARKAGAAKWVYRITEVR